MDVIPLEASVEVDLAPQAAVEPFTEGAQRYHDDVRQTRATALGRFADLS